MNINGEIIDMTGFNAEFKAVVINTFSKIIETYNLKVVEHGDEEIDGQCSVHLLNEKANYKLLVGFNLYHGAMLRYADLTKTDRDHAMCRLDFCLSAIHHSSPDETKLDTSKLFANESVGQISHKVVNMLNYFAHQLVHYAPNILEGHIDAHSKIMKINEEYFKERREQEDWERKQKLFAK